MTMTGGYPEIDDRRFRNVLGRFCTGITVITTCTSPGDDIPAEPIGFDRDFERRTLLCSLKNRVFDKM